MTNLDKQLADRYFNNELTENEEKAFEQRLEIDQEFLLAVFADKFAEASLQLHPLKKALLIIKKLGDDLFAGDWPDEKKTEPSGFVLEDILPFYTPVKHLEEEAIARSAENSTHSLLQEAVVLPENDMDCIGRWLYFALDQNIPHALEAIILDNREAVKIKKAVDPNNCDFKIDVESLHPGRYYWHLRLAKTAPRKAQNEYDTATGSFWIQRSLLNK